MNLLVLFYSRSALPTGTRSTSPAKANRGDVMVSSASIADALRALAVESSTMRSEIGSGLLDGETGWRISNRHESGCAAFVFVMQASIGKLRGVATKWGNFAQSAANFA
jgi:hypothetical protein